jgi:hypothetical protein
VDAQEFDELVAKLTSAPSRRAALKGALGGALAAIGHSGEAISRGKGGNGARAVVPAARARARRVDATGPARRVRGTTASIAAGCGPRSAASAASAAPSALPASSGGNRSARRATNGRSVSAGPTGANRSPLPVRTNHWPWRYDAAAALFPKYRLTHATRAVRWLTIRVRSPPMSPHSFLFPILLR